MNRYVPKQRDPSAITVGEFYAIHMAVHSEDPDWEEIQRKSGVREERMPFIMCAREVLRQEIATEKRDDFPTDAVL